MEERERGLKSLDEVSTGCTLVFVPQSDMYQPLSALAILAGLNAMGFTGTCECYIQPTLRSGEYLMGIGLKFAGDAADADWWGSLADNVAAACDDDNEVRLNRDACEFTTVGQLRSELLHAGTAGFEAGWAVWVSDPVGPDPDSPFTGLCRRVKDEGDAES
jgi:hypothetical protein